LERSKGVDMTTRLNRARGSKAKVIVIDEGDNEPDEAFAFWKELGPKDAIRSADDAGEDASLEAEISARNKLFRYDPDSDSYERVEGSKLLYEMLDTNECYMLDCVGEIYIWNGKTSPTASRTANYNRACELLESERDTRPAFLEAVVKCNCGGEPVLFTEKFANWPSEATLGVGKVPQGRIAPSKKQVPVDVKALLAAEMPEVAPDVDSAADGLIDIWRVVDTQKVAVAKEHYGHFWSSHCYIILYTWNLGGAVSDRSYIIYFWQGHDASINEMGTAAALSLNMSKDYRGASQVRVSQFSEPAHFHRIFRGKFAIHHGKEPEGAPAEEEGTHLFHVRGNTDRDTCAVEVPEPAVQCLDTNDVFVLTNGKSRYLWRGKNSNDNAMKAAKALCDYLQGSFDEQSEGSEDSGFWKALGASKPSDDEAYASEKVHHPGWVGRAYVFTTKTGIVTAEPMWHYVQSDFVPEIMVLFDAYHSVYLWMGAEAKEKDKKVALEAAVDYAKVAPTIDSGRGKMNVLQIGSGTEPLAFKCQFHCWLKPKPSKKGRANALGASAPASMASVEDALNEYSKKYTYEELKNKESLPPSVDRSKLEMYLTDEEFNTVFGMSREQYLALPAWQRLPKKKRAGLY